MSRRAGSAGAFALVVCMQWSTAARADEPVASFEDGKDLLVQARELYVEGTRAVHQGQWDRARLFYLSAWRAQHHWQIAGSLGHAEAAMDRNRDAAEHLSIFVRETRDLAGVDPRDAAALARELERARARVGTVSVTVAPAGAEVLIDGVPAGRAPLVDPVFVEPGRHVIEARLDGYRSASEARDLAPGGVAPVSLRLTQIPPPAPPPVLSPRAVAPPAVAPPRGGPIRAVVIGGAALGVVATGVGIGLAAASSAKAAASTTCETSTTCNGASTLAGRRDAFAALQDQKVALARASVGTFVGAGVVAAGTVTYALVGARRANAPRAGLIVYPGGVAASVSTTW